MQYRIADRFLDGYKRRFIGIAMFTAQEEAVEMLYRIQSRSPGSPLAEKAMLRTADFYFDDQTGHCESAALAGPTGHVISGIRNPVLGG